MSVKIRFKRMGMPKQPYYRLVAIDSRSARDAQELETLGDYNPRDKNRTLNNLKKERVKYWLSCGAQPSETVRELLAGSGVFSEPKPQTSDKSSQKTA